MRSPGRRRGASRARLATLLVGLAGILLFGAAPAHGQYRLVAPSGDTLTFPRDSVQAMLARTRALYDTLEADPDIVYYVGYGRVVPESRPGAAYPWNAVRVRSDSAVQVVTPDNLREADRAYFNYAVTRMRERTRTGSGDGPGECDGAVAREARLLASFADGWIVARVLFGGAAYPPLGEIAFAREAGHLEAFAADHEPADLEECAARWRDAHPDRTDSYRQWRDERFLGAPDAGSTATSSVHSLRGR